MPKNNPERLALAQAAYDTGRYSAAARLWAEALESDRKIADDRRLQHRYNAACAAALAGCGKTRDIPAPDEPAPQTAPSAPGSMLNCPFGPSSSHPPSPKSAAAIAQTLEHWRVDSDLAGVREPDAIDALPEPERADSRRALEERRGSSRPCQLQIIFADRVKHIQRQDGAIQCSHAVEHAAGNAPHVAGTEQPGHAADRELEPALEQDAHLFVGMGVLGDDGVRARSGRPRA